MGFQATDTLYSILGRTRQLYETESLAVEKEALMCRKNAKLLKFKKSVVNVLDRNRVFSPKEL
jgi:hypothetical protein